MTNQEALDAWVEIQQGNVNPQAILCASQVAWHRFYERMDKEDRDPNPNTALMQWYQDVVPAYHDFIEAAAASSESVPV